MVVALVADREIELRVRTELQASRVVIVARGKAGDHVQRIDEFLRLCIVGEPDDLHVKVSIARRGEDGVGVRSEIAVVVGVGDVNVVVTLTLQ